MRARHVTLLWTLLLGGVTACGGAPHGAAGQVAREFPVARKIPARVTYVLALARVDRAASLARDLLRPFGSLEADLTPEAVDGTLRKELKGKSWLNAADLTDIGVAFDGNVAIFSSGIFPTLLVPVADKTKLSGYIDKLAVGVTLKTRERKGVYVSTWSDEWVQLSYAFVGDFLAVHLAEAKDDPNQWLDEILSAGDGLAGEPDLGWALAQGGGRHDAVGLVRFPALVAALARLDSRRQAECKPFGDWLANQAGRIAFFGSFDKGRGDGGLVLELPAESRARLRAQATTDAAAERLREGAAIWLAMAIDPRLFAELRKPTSDERMCAVADPLAMVYRLPGLIHEEIPGLTGLRVAVVRAGDAGRAADLDAFATVDLRDHEAASELARELGGDDVSEGAVKTLSLPFLATPVSWTLVGNTVQLSVGKSHPVDAKRPSARAAAADGAVELFALELSPDLIPDVKPLFQLLARSSGDQTAKMLAIIFSHYRHYRLSVSLVPEGIRVAGGFELR